MKEYTVAILGATGAVGTRLIEQLEQSTIPVKKVKFLASKRSAGKELTFKGKTVIVEEATPEAFTGVDLVLASAGGGVSKKLLPEAVKRGAVCVDNTSAFRMEPEVPLVVPEVNEKALFSHRGAGQSALEQMLAEAQAYLNNEPMEGKVFPVKGDKKHYPLAFNLLPQIDVFEEDGYSHEEWKMIHETKKIMLDDMDAPELKVTATCVRVPVVIGHGESVYFTTKDQTVTPTDIKELLKDAPGVTLQDDPKNQVYPQPLTAEGKRDTFVGRIRADKENPGSFNMWVVSDNLLKGAAWNTVQIAERLVENDLVRVPEDPYLG